MARSFTLAKDGASAYVLAVPAHETDSAQFAAAEIQRYIKRISGAELRIVEADQAGPSILLTIDPASPGVDIDLAPERIRVAGSDRFHLLHAAYLFLETLGCRWFAPDYTFYGSVGGAFIPKANRILLAPAQLRHRAVFAHRKKYVEEGRSHTVQHLRQLIDWMPKVGLNTFVCPIDWSHEGRAVWDNWREQLTPDLERRGIRIEVGGHGYENFLSATDLTDHADWAGLAPDQHRELDPTKRTFCTTNQAAVARFKANVADYLRTHPEVDIFDCWPPDTRDWCVCATCQAAGPIPERHARLVNEVARQAQQIRPGLRIAFPAYYEPTSPPTEVALDQNVIVDFCPITRSYQSPIYDVQNKTNRFYNERLRAWFETKRFGGTVCVYTYYRKYAWRSLPILLPELIAKDLRYYADLGVEGIGSYSEPADWWTYELQHYALARLSWDPTTDLRGLLDDYLHHRYAAAAKPMREFILSLGKFLPDVARIPGTEFPASTTESDDVYEFWNTAAIKIAPYRDHVAACRRHLAEAVRLAADEDHVRERLDRWQVLIDYVDLEVQARGLALSLAERATGGFLRRYQNVMRRMRELALSNRDNGLILYDEWAEYTAERL